MDGYAASALFTYRICPNCHRLVSDRSDGAHSKPHPCFTPAYLAGYFIGLIPQHMERVIKISLEPLGIEADEAFVQGFRDGMEAAEKYGVNRSTVDPTDSQQRVHAAWYEGRQDGEADFVKRVETCHCGNAECQQFKAEHPAELVLQPCHCGTQGCLELCTIEQPVDDFRLLMHVPPGAVNARRRQFWWEDDEETR